MNYQFYTRKIYPQVKYHQKNQNTKDAREKHMSSEDNKSKENEEWKPKRRRVTRLTIYLEEKNKRE